MKFVDLWHRHIEKDLTPFVDPGTTLELQQKGNVIEASWAQRRATMSARFVVDDEERLAVAFNGKDYSYRSFFASEGMADILGMAQSTTQLHRASQYVETLASTQELEEQIVEKTATGLIAQLVAQRDEESILTSFIMVTGEAGAGKTSVLKELVRRQAEAYTKGKVDFVYLYVDAQGRALARFNEALATELNELRVQLPIHAVPPMVRLGLIVPVIDGFDELIGAGGYDDAFSSISSFIEQLEGKGTIVASARSTYYEQEFLSRADRAAQFEDLSWRLRSLEVKSWGDGERRAFVRLKAGSDNKLADSLLVGLNKVFAGENLPLGEKPLFVVRVGDLLLRGEDLSGEGRLLEQLVDAFITREQKEKLLSKAGKPILSRDQLRSLCEDFAEEMWNLGTRELDRITIRDLAELAMAGSNASAADKSTVVERMPSMAFLRPGEAHGSVSFEHELFFDLFLTRRFASKILDKTAGLQLFLGRSAMPDSLADAVAVQINAVSTKLHETSQVLSEAGRMQGPRQQFVRENSGRVLGHICAYSKRAHDLRIHDVIFPGSVMSDVVFENVEFERVEFKRVELVGARFDRCRSKECLFEAPLLSQSTSLGVSGVMVADFVGIRLIGVDGRIASIFDPLRIFDTLRSMHLPSAQTEGVEPHRSVPEAILHLIERLARAYAKCNPICEQDDFLRAIFDDPNWPRVKKLLLASGVSKEEERPAHGTRRNFIRRLVRAEELPMGVKKYAAVSEPVKKFWGKLEEEFADEF